MTDWRRFITDVPDFPAPGVVFKDITPLLADGPAFAAVVDELATIARPLAPTHLVGVESRGFIFGAALARALSCGLILVRKPGKLPRAVRRVDYTLEYGSDAVELHAGDLEAGDRALIIDDVLATGGTAAATAELVAGTGAELAGMAFVIELGFLGGRARLPAAVPATSLLTIE